MHQCHCLVRIQIDRIHSFQQKCCIYIVYYVQSSIKLVHNRCCYGRGSCYSMKMSLRDVELSHSSDKLYSKTFRPWRSLSVTKQFYNLLNPLLLHESSPSLKFMCIYSTDCHVRPQHMQSLQNSLQTKGNRNKALAINLHIRICGGKLNNVQIVSP